jgi:hypothetical protein
MTSFVVQHFNELKRLVLETGGYKSVSPSDCKSLSLVIYKKTGHQLSETTLKRVYGFAYSKFKPSQFTLDAMAQYCGFGSWVDYCDHNGTNKIHQPVQDVQWENIKLNASKITNFTLQALKNRSGIPYGQTIRRRFMDMHFDAFAHNNHTATVLAAPAGYGKTIALCHWVEEKLAMNIIGSSNDIVLFFSSSALINAFISGKDINEWLLSLLGYGGEEHFSALLDINRKRSGNFYLVIDGLDEHMLKESQFQILFNQVLDVFSFYKDHENFKLVLTMRSFTWLNNRHELVDKSKWYEGNLGEGDLAINVPLFSLSEIRELCTNINPAARNAITAEIAGNFNHPLYLQFYYKQNRDDFSLNGIDRVCIYELISAFILNKVYLSSHATEKILIIRALTQAMDYENEVYDVDKLKLNDLIRQYSAAYNDLQGIGLIREINRSNDLSYKIIVQFGNDNFLNYSLAALLLHRNNNAFDKALIDTINGQFKGSRKVQILKWCLLYAIRNGQQQSFGLLAYTQLTAAEKSEIIIFMGDMFDKSHFPHNKAESLIQYFNQDCSDILFDYFFGLEFISADYTKTLHTLLRFDLSPRKKIMIYSALALIATMQLDAPRFEGYLANLKAFPHQAFAAFAINPLNCLDTIYYYLKYGIIKKEAFAELTRFYFNPPVEKLEKNNTNDVLCLLAAHTLLICNEPFKMLRFTNALNKVYKDTADLTQGFDFILQIRIAKAYFDRREKEQSLTAYRTIDLSYETNSSSFTPFMKASYYLLKIKICAFDGEETGLLQTMEMLNELADKADLKLIRIQALAFLLSNKTYLNINEEYIKQAGTAFNELMAETDFKPRSFMNNDVAITIR